MLLSGMIDRRQCEAAETVTRRSMRHHRDITDRATMGIFRCALNVIAHRLRLS